MRIARAILTIFTVALVMFMLAAGAQADTKFSKRTVVTFNQPVEIPGQVLPSGTYTIELYESFGNRNIVRIYNADRSQADRNRAGDSEPASDANRDNVIEVHRTARQCIQTH